MGALLNGCSETGDMESNGGTSTPGGGGQTLPPNEFSHEKAWGVYGWGGSAASPFYRGIKGTNTTVLWSDLEPSEGDFRFDEVIGSRLEAFREKGMRTFLKIYISPLSPEQYNSPRWLFEDKGVPIVEVTDSSDPFGEPLDWTYPWYLDETYRHYLHRMIRAFGQWLRELPEELRETVLFVQVAEGCTSDGQAYKGTPLDARYRLTQESWLEYREAVWVQYREALTDPGTGKILFPLAVNFTEDLNFSAEFNWMKASLGEVVGFKNGMFSHGYDICDEIQRKRMIDSLRSILYDEGRRLFIRGEQDKEWRNCGWSVKNPDQAFYWSAIYASHCGLDMWNFPSDACANERFAPAIDFFNKYAGPHRATESSVAFCALRKGLNAADKCEFPESEYGAARKDNIARYEAIVRQYADHGAMQGDPEKAIGTNMQNRQRADYNDAGWNIFPGNYEKFLHQLHADESSVGWWHVDDTIYGCFARGFDHAAGRTGLYFALEEGFGNECNPLSVRIDVTSLDRGIGWWSLCCAKPNGEIRTLLSVTNTDSGEWRVHRVRVRDLDVSGKGPYGSHFFLRWDSGEDTLFHLIEVASSGSLPDLGTAHW